MLVALNVFRKQFRPEKSIDSIIGQIKVEKKILKD